MQIPISTIIQKLDTIRHASSNGGHYWLGRELMPVLGYTEWRNFESVIKRGIQAYESVGEDKNDHFVGFNKMIEVGKSARRSQNDYYLTRYACYLIAQNGDPAKIEIAAAQTYFAIQTRLQEKAQTDNQTALEQRIHLLHRVTKAVKELNQTAKQAGVQNYAAFQNAGYKGLYSMGLADIKKRKNIPDKENLFDRAGRAELAANEFRLTQAEEKIKRENISTEKEAAITHQQIGAAVRNVIQKIGGTMPEDLPTEASIKQLAKKKDRQLEQIKE